MHVTERMRQTGVDKIGIETTVEDPTVLAKPWVASKVYTRHRDQMMNVEY